MRIRESDLPDENEWTTFFDPMKILRKMGLDKHVGDVADFGCGYGTFTIPAAQIVSGKVYAIDIDTEMVNIVKQKAYRNSLKNIETFSRDIQGEGSGLKDESVDYVFLFNVLHAQYPEGLLKEAHRVLRKTGCVAILNWRVDPTTPCGPPVNMRPSLEQSVKWCVKAGFDPSSTKTFNFKPYHYGLVMRKLSSRIQ